ncbi:MAG: tetratricopeptide repeat protein [Clostridia bacterium]|nr:tetratricopeptide repeat protein [Clostridia bacterium]
MTIVLLILLAILLLFYFKFSAFCTIMATQSYQRGQIESAFNWFSKAEQRGMDMNQKITYAYYLLREGKVEKSEELLKAVLAETGQSQLKNLAKANYATLLIRTGRVAEAIEELEEILPYFKNTTVYGSLGYAYILAGDLEKAEAFNKEAYEYNSDNAIILDNMIQLYTKLSDYETAYTYVKKQDEKGPGFIEAFYNMAVVEKALGKTEDAIEHLERALSIRPTFLSAVNHDDVKALLETIQ